MSATLATTQSATTQSATTQSESGAMAPFHPDDLARLPQIVGADLAPDADFVVFAATTRDGDSSLEYPLLWRGDGTGAVELLLDAESGFSSPSISPDGTKVAVLQSIDDKNQVAVVTLADLSVITLTDFPRGVGAETPQWSPDGEVLAFTASDLPVRDPKRPYRVSQTVWRRDGMGLIDDVRSDLWTVPAGGGPKFRVTTLGGVVSGIEWSPDGKALLYNCFAEPDSEEFTIRTVAPDGTGEHVVMRGEYLVYAPAARWLSDGRIVRTSAWGVYKALDLVIHDPATGTDSPLGTHFEGQLFGGLQAGMDSTLFEPKLVVDQRTDTVYLPVQTGGRLEVHTVSVADGSCTLLVTGDSSSTPLVLRGTSLLLARTTFHHPVHLVVAGLDDSSETTVAKMELAWLRSSFTVHPWRFPGADGVSVEGWFLEPTAGQGPYPTVLDIHGGPFSGYGHVFSVDVQSLTAAGYGVLLVNYRGSSGYGEAFAARLIGDWGTNDAGDLLAGLDHGISLGLIDPAGLVSFGISGGGNLTTWLLTHSDRFATGIAEAPVTDWMGMIGSDIPQVIARWMDAPAGGGTAAAAEYARMSPATYAADCTTPMLIIEHDGDLRCPPGQGDLMYNALRATGCESEMFRIPGWFHTGCYGYRDIEARSERLTVIREWIDSHLPA